MTRWEALVRYDDEIRKAAEKLMPFGAMWVDKFGEAFFALNEDRKYIPKMVEQLVKEAEHQAFCDWLHTFSTTREGEATNEDALRVLIQAQAKGYQLAKDKDGTFLVSGMGRGTSCLRSNADIIRFGSFSLP